MRRRMVIVAIVAGVIVFLAIATLLTRAFNVGDAENAAITSLVQAEARGDTGEVISLITGCKACAACRARAAANTAALRHPGKVSIAEINPSSTFSVATTSGTARVAWVVGQLAPARPVPARPPRGQRDSGIHDPAAGGQPADRERRRLPHALLVAPRCNHTRIRGAPGGARLCPRTLV